MRYINDASGTSYTKTADLGDDEEHLALLGWDEIGNGYYSFDGSAPADHVDATAATGFRDIATATGFLNFPGSGNAHWKGKIGAAFHWHGRSRWSAAEATEFYSIRAGSGGRVLTMLRHRIFV